MTKSITIKSELYNDVKEYCNLNNLDINELIEKFIADGLMIEKYGDTPFATYNVVVKKVEPVESVEQTIVIEKPMEEDKKPSKENECDIPDKPITPVTKQTKSRVRKLK